MRISTDFSRQTTQFSTPIIFHFEFFCGKINPVLSGFQQIFPSRYLQKLLQIENFFTNVEKLVEIVKK